MNNQNVIENLAIDDLGHQGEGIAKLNGLAVFVDHALPQEIIDAQVFLKKRSYLKAKLLKVSGASPQRVKPICSKFQTCGGCQIMHLDYQGQLQYKTQKVWQTLRRIGKFDSPQVLPCLATNELYYRNKVQLPVGKDSNGLILGFYEQGTHNIVPYEKCHTHEKSLHSAVPLLKSAIESSQVSSYCEADKTGTLRHVILRTNSKGEILLGLVTTGKERTKVRMLASTLAKSIPQLCGVIESINQKPHNAILGAKTQVLWGSNVIEEEVLDLKFQISLASFFQVNLEGACILYDIALKFAGISKESTVLDAYCGIGTMSLLAAKKAKKVIGIEVVLDAVKDAKSNAILNDIHNVQFIAGKVEDHIATLRDIDTTLLNPPRKGLDPKVVEALNDFGSKALVYVSCNPATLARDLALLTNYNLQNVQPVDMFPQTAHVECVAKLVRK